MSQADKTAQGPHTMNAMNMGGMPMAGMPIGQPNMNSGLGPAAQNEKAQLNTYIYDYFLKHHMVECAQAILKEGDVHLNGSRRTSPSRRPPKHDADGHVMTNGMDESMENADGSRPQKAEEGEEKDFPLPSVPAGPQCFLFDWWCLFWDIFTVRTTGKGTPQAMQYLSSTQQAQRMRQQEQHMMLRQLNPQQQAQLLHNQVQNQGMNPGPVYQNPILRQGFANGVMVGQDGGLNDGNKLMRQAMLNSNKRAPQAQQLGALKNPQMVQQAVQRDQDVDMNGQQQRPLSPAGSQAAASPGTKRRNLGGGDYQEVGPGARGQTPANAQAANATAVNLLMASGIDPNRLSREQFAALQGQPPHAQAKSIAAYAQGVAQHTQHARTVIQQKGMPHVHGGPAGQSPMMPHTTEGTPMMIPDFYGGAGNMRMGQAPASNHALHEYQMQLMLLEQQNKKRLLMARQESGILEGRVDQGNNFQGMSPQGPRAAPSPQPPGDMKRGTPKLNPQAGPGSPLPDGQIAGQIAGQQQRNSPATSMPNFNAQVPLDASVPMFYNPNKLNEMLGAANGAGIPNGAMMRPPGGHVAFNGQMTPAQIQEQVVNNPNLRQAQAARGQPVGAWPPQHPGMTHTQIIQAHAAQQAQQAQQAQAAQAQAQANAHQQGPQQNAGTPNQGRPNVGHAAMPPPSAPANQANGRAPSSPQVNNQQPPTPTQANKAVPKRKGDKERKKKANAAPSQAPNAATSSEPPTPTTPHPPNSFNNAVHKPNNFAPGATGQPGTGPQNVPQPIQQPPPAVAPPPPMPQPDAMPPAPFNEDVGLFSDFSGDAGNDTLLDHFDFDSFLHNPDDGGSTNMFDPSAFQFQDTVEAGAGDS